MNFLGGAHLWAWCLILPSQPASAKSARQVGSANSDRVNYTLAQKFFHNKDVRPEVLDAKKTVVKSKQSNILGTEAKAWNSSTVATAKDATVALGPLEGARGLAWSVSRGVSSRGPARWADALCSLNPRHPPMRLCRESL